jgi:hypothetical protein
LQVLFVLLPAWPAEGGRKENLTGDVTQNAGKGGALNRLMVTQTATNGGMRGVGMVRK